MFSCLLYTSLVFRQYNRQREFRYKHIFRSSGSFGRTSDVRHREFFTVTRKNKSGTGNANKKCRFGQIRHKSCLLYTSQWGSENLGAQGYSALNILRYYYGEDIELASTDVISDFPRSYPGSPLSFGSQGSDVEYIRRQLYRIAANYPLIPRINPVYRVFDSALDSAVRVFQEIFGLTVDGIVGKATWYKISYVYASILKLAELGGAGEAGTLPETPPTVVLKRGDTGRDVRCV